MQPGYYDYYALDPKESVYNRSWEYSRKTYDLDLSFPLQTRYVFNHHWEVSLLVEEMLYDRENNDLVGAAWFTFTW